MCPQRQAISQVVCSDRSGDFSAEDKKFRTKIAKRLKEGISVAAFASCPFVLRAGRNPRCDQGEAQAEHCAKVAGDLLPRDLVHGGKTFTQLFRSHGKGGKVVMLENSLPGRASGHRFVVFKIEIENGREQLGEEIASPHTLERAIEIAAQS